MTNTPFGKRVCDEDKGLHDAWLVALPYSSMKKEGCPQCGMMILGDDLASVGLNITNHLKRMHYDWFLERATSIWRTMRGNQPMPQEYLDSLGKSDQEVEAAMKEYNERTGYHGGTYL